MHTYTNTPSPKANASFLTRVMTTSDNNNTVASFGMQEIWFYLHKINQIHTEEEGPGSDDMGFAPVDTELFENVAPIGQQMRQQQQQIKLQYWWFCEYALFSISQCIESYSFHTLHWRWCWWFLTFICSAVRTQTLRKGATSCYTGTLC